MNALLITLIVAVALEAAVILVLVARMRQRRPARTFYEEPMPWETEK